MLVEWLPIAVNIVNKTQLQVIRLKVWSTVVIQSRRQRRRYDDHV